MKPIIKILFFSLAVLFMASIFGCKKHIFKPIEFKGHVIKEDYVGWNIVEIDAPNITVVLYKKKGSLLAKNGILKDEKEIGSATTSSDGSFSMKLKSLDTRDTYYVKCFYNNKAMQIYSDNYKFSGYKALTRFTEFKIRE